MVKRLPFFILLFAMLAGATAHAQQEIVSITDWRMHNGDDPAWSQPELDDSAWEKSSYPVMNFNDLQNGGWLWYRGTFQVPADFHGPDLALGMAALDDAYEVYIDGALVGRFGILEPAPRGIYPRHLVFSIPRNLLQGSVGHIAVRRHKGAWSMRLMALSRSGLSSNGHPPRVGNTGTIEVQKQEDLDNGAIQMLLNDLVDLMFLFAGTISFVLFSVQYRRPEYLYLGLFCIASGAPQLAAIAITSSQTLDSRCWESVLVYFVSELPLVFSPALLAVLSPRFRRIFLFVAALGLLMAIFAAYSIASNTGHQTAFISIKTWAFPVFNLLAVWGLLADRNKGSLTIGIALLLSYAVTAWNNTRILLNLPTPMITAGPFQIDPRNLGGLMFIFVVLLVLYLRYRDEQDRQAAAAQNLAAARRMQEQLLATSDESPAGFDIRAVYRPAQEVGGDFYRTELLEDGSLLVVVGDVSGKGLDAALLVAAVLGGLAVEKQHHPAQLLEDLNKAVTGRTGGGFITACCARFFPDGRVEIANAGHISPYIDGREVQLENGLPLGISTHAEYSETEIETNETVTFLSDGVVEARDTKGELFGFDRTAALTTKTATEIADAAQRWGQEDDITVLTVARLTESAA
jgi:sigma-B regulation protein RsbU (phosphoserine phosphatase)